MRKIVHQRCGKDESGGSPLPPLAERLKHRILKFDADDGVGDDADADDDDGGNDGNDGKSG